MKEGGDREGHKMYKHDWAKHVHTGVLHQAHKKILFFLHIRRIIQLE